MPEKYHIKTSHVLPRLPRIGKCGIVDWREDCAGCHNCVKKACVYDRYREESAFIRDLDEVHTLYYECMGCFSCVQNCTKNLLTLALNSEYQKTRQPILEAANTKHDMVRGGNRKGPGLGRRVQR
jgi:Na+-translocating ferredoxin:NAD+ oxidoreductase RNF subunit RnfB